MFAVLELICLSDVANAACYDKISCERPFKMGISSLYIPIQRSSPLQIAGGPTSDIGKTSDKTDMWAWKISMLPCRSFEALAVALPCATFAVARFRYTTHYAADSIDESSVEQKTERIRTHTSVRSRVGQAAMSH
ncbi:hypothetical protein LY78DRAFT_410845 [Colletotrichum sublineola]|nr:hypothetical protein LY78DRAFT_410845 [Colletotrichum sublineola]